jgi:hypothetical protein
MHRAIAASDDCDVMFASRVVQLLQEACRIGAIYI